MTGRTRELSSRVLTTMLAWHPRLSQEQLILFSSAFFALVSNHAFWASAWRLHPGDPMFLAAMFGLLVVANGLLLSLLTWQWSAKPVITVLLFTTALATHFMSTYGVFMDADMLRNVLHTDMKESRELMTPQLLWPLLFTALLPALLLWRVRIAQRATLRSLWVRPLFMLGLAALAGVSALLAPAHVAAMMRNHREVRYLATPINYMVALQQDFRSSSPMRSQPRIPIGTDAKMAPHVVGDKPRLLVLVLGETVRAQDWGLNGYARQTTPELARLGVLNFPDMHSCGTSTEVSVPCMFSQLGRRHYDEHAIRQQQSLLNVLEYAGIKTLWRDNQSGCKGVCDGLAIERLDDAKVPGLCAHGRCLDEVLLHELAAKIRAAPGDRVVVLHQLGSHGPNYFQRYPANFRHFTPPCEDPELGNCRQQDIVNAYDNSVLYTDHFLAMTIAELQGMDDYDTAMIYVSDHGESLGEKGLYLHGMPYAIAPQEQTRVPMVMWFSTGFSRARGLDLGCLQRRAWIRTDHDAIFPSILGLMQVRTSAYDRSHDLFAGCSR
jgi:lipid A ethanolaminephosphotransferase